MTIVRKNRGRPPAFDRHEVLERAMQVFWASGYDGASIPMLTEAMGISPQSLYAAFGSKEALYREALTFYSTTIGGYVVRALQEENDAVDAIERMLRESANVFARTTGTPGCMITTAPVDASTNALATLGAQMRAASVDVVEKRLQQGINEGQVLPDADVMIWARYVGSIVQGMSIQARDGASAAALLEVTAIAIHSLQSIRRIRTKSATTL
jgi:AcrR family transcriptional regulator